ncbi:glycosyl hydrolase [Sulfurovum sp.]|uniref:glycoside hydrolase family 17 protein n=1 Tax=Sulfurovum sp. TaxID=1969726 RepID=UPI002867B8D6|nr:glycosyl hydrolase [Sulfurovum sp.]
MIKKISTILAGFGLIVLFWYLVGEVFILKNSNDPIARIECVSYAPFSKDQSPFQFDEGMVISEEQVREDLALLSQYTNCIRTYSTVGMETVPKIAREHGMKMYMGAWVSSDKASTALEIKTLISLAREYKDVVKAVIVGNEVLLRNDTTDKVLTAYIKEVKNALLDTPVTYADVWEFWLKYPAVGEATDFVTIHILPYWEDNPMNIKSAIKHLESVRENVEAILKDKNILIGETGWPSEGRMREDALPSKINQAIFIREFVKLAEQKRWNYNVIEAFDQPWKRASEGAVGGAWGMFDKDREDKKVFYGDVSNFPNYKPLALGSILLFFAFSFLLRGSNIQTKHILVFSGMNALFAILFMLQMEQYSVTVRTNIELLCAFIVSVTHLFIYYFLLLLMAKGTKLQILSLDEILKKKIFYSDTSLVILFYLSFTFILISNLTLAFEGRYRNFEIYIFMISISSYLWLYRENFENLNLGRFEKVSFLILLLTSLTIFINETYLNIYSNIWVLISLGFAYILYRGTKKVSYGELKELVLYMLAFFTIFAFVRYGILSNSALSAECNTSGSSFMCNIKTALGVAVYVNGFGIIAILSTLVASFVNQKFISLLALFFSIAALVMFNTLLGSIAFVSSVFLLTKNGQDA